MTRVIPFQKPKADPPSDIAQRIAEGMAWFHCAGNCGALVTSAGAVCLACAAKDEQ